jgi:hypothetical protein
VTPIDLFYGSATSWIPLPYWGLFFVEMGITLNTYDNRQRRVIVGIVPPTLSYAASLISFGVTVGKFAPIDRGDEAVRRFQQLSTLENGTSLFYRQKKKLIKVFFDGFKEMNGEIMICLDTKTNGERYYITPKQALQVEFPAKSFSISPKRPSRRITAHPSQFMSSLLDTNTATAIASQSSLDSLIIGSLYRLKEEIQDRPFAAKKDGEFIPGSLQDIVRVRKFSRNTETYRSEIYQVNSKECENVGQEIPTVVIFDGAKSFLRWRTYWCQSHWVVLLDQTEPDFDIAIQAFNYEYVMSPIHSRELLGFPLAPAHIPTTMYQEEQL